MSHPMPELVAVRTEQVDGLTFLVPTWDREADRWAEDEALEERVLVAIRERLPEHEALEREALTASRCGPDDEYCSTFWGSHGCDRPSGHSGLHVCRGCSAIHPITPTHAVLWWADEIDEDDDTVLSWRLCSHAWQWWSEKWSYRGDA